MEIDEGYCACAACGKVITIPIDPALGSDQRIAVACGDCRCRIEVRILIEDSGDIRVSVDRD